VYLFHREGKFRYEFQKGKPWLHEDLIAPFSFPIYKPENELLAEKDSILKEFKPYFKYDSTVVIEELENFKKEFNARWVNYLKEKYNIEDESLLNNNIRAHRLLIDSRERYFIFALSLLEFVYSKGIVQVTDVLDRVREENGSIVVIRNNIGEEYEYSEIFSQKTAYEYVIREVNKQIDEFGKEGAESESDFFNKLNLNEFILPNLVYDEETSNNMVESLIGEISLTRGMVQAGERIISKGDLAKGNTHRILQSLKYEYETKLGESSSYNFIFIGQFILVSVIILVLFLFLFHFRKEILYSSLKTSFILFLVVLIVFITSMVLKFNFISFYIIPFAVVPIIIRTFYDERLALSIHIVTLLIIGFLAPNAFEFVFLNIIAGTVAIFNLTNLYRRRKLFTTSAFIVISYSVIYLGMSVIQEGNFSSIEWINFGWFGGNGLLVLTSYPLIYLFEKTFGFLSDFTLMELSDTNQPLLRQLAEKAPGTFQHSLQVANLAEEAIYLIGGNLLLVRTGALYHDIGKMENPIYFIENQNPELNPHDALEFKESAELIISHVEKGVKIAKKHNLPEQIINFIETHHGTTKVEYFYRSFVKKYPKETFDIKQFSYPGPEPFSKETVVLMMADSVEAASRSLKKFSEQTIDDLVENIISYQLSTEQFINADITFNNITIIKGIFKKKLMNIYHARIEYPK